MEQFGYDLWGVPTLVSESVPQQLRYDGYWYDTETGWYWLQIRAYDPVLKRFLQPDPSGQDGQFSYAYVGDDPVGGSDPTGLCNAGDSSTLPDSSGYSYYTCKQIVVDGVTTYGFVWLMTDYEAHISQNYSFEPQTGAYYVAGRDQQGQVDYVATGVTVGGPDYYGDNEVQVDSHQLGVAAAQTGYSYQFPGAYVNGHDPAQFPAPDSMSLNDTYQGNSIILCNDSFGVSCAERTWTQTNGPNGYWGPYYNIDEDGHVSSSFPEQSTMHQLYGNPPSSGSSGPPVSAREGWGCAVGAVVGAGGVEAVAAFGGPEASAGAVVGAVVFGCVAGPLGDWLWSSRFG